MKKHLLILTILLTAIVGQGQTNVYHPFPDSNANWNIQATGCCWANCPPPPNTNPIIEDYYFSYTITGDTLINSYIYHKIQKTGWKHTGCAFGNSIDTWSPINHYAGAFRQDTFNKKVYYILQGLGQEDLLYDYNLNVGDSLKFDINCYRIVSSIDSILIGNNYRKRLNFSNGPPVSIIDGIGSSAGLIETICPFEYSANLLCFAQNGQLVFPDTATNCEILTKINEINHKSTFSILPNPFSSQTTLQTNKVFKDATLTVYNSFGQKVKQIKNISGQTITLHRDNLPSGLYFLQLTQDNKIITTDKIIIIDR